MAAPKVTNQGKIQIANIDGDWMVVFPAGTMKAFATREAAEEAARTWFKSDAKKRRLPIGVGITETDP